MSYGATIYMETTVPKLENISHGRATALRYQVLQDGTDSILLPAQRPQGHMLSFAVERCSLYKTTRSCTACRTFAAQTTVNLEL